MILNLGYRIPEADRYTRAGGFRQEMTMDLMGIGCSGKIAGFIGPGEVGGFMVPRLRASNMDVLYTKRKDEILERSDFVCMECSYNSSTHQMIGAREFKLMKPTAYFINTGRGRLVDEPALIRALHNNTIAGAGLDVFWDEPPVTHDPHIPAEFCEMDNVILAPHNGGATWDTRGEMGQKRCRADCASIKKDALLH